MKYEILLNGVLRLKGVIDPITEGLVGILGLCLEGAPGANIDGVSGTVSLSDCNSLYNYTVCAGENVYDCGLVVGNGSGTPTPNDKDLFSRLGSAYVSYTSTTLSIYNPDSSTIGLEITRTVTNISQSTINITEVGVMACQSPSSSGSQNPFLLLHAMLDSPVSLAPNSSLQITVRIYNSLG